MRPQSQELQGGAGGSPNRLPRGIGRVNDISVTATNNHAVLEGEKGLCIVDLSTDDNQSRVVAKQKSYESGKIECNPNLSHSSIVASSSGSSLILLDISSEKTFISANPAHTRAMTGLSWNRHNPVVLATSSLDATIKIWDVRAPKAVRNSVVKTFISAQSHLHWSPHSSHLLASSHGGEVKLWDIRVPDFPQEISGLQGKQQDRFIGYMSDICAIGWATAEDNVLLTCTKDKPAKIWSTEKFPSQLLYTVPMNLPIQSAVFFPPSSHHILTSHCAHNCLYMWDTENTKSFEPLVSLPMGDDPIIAFDFQFIGQAPTEHICVIAITKDFSLRKWPIPSDFAASMIESPPHEKREGYSIEDDFVPVDLALEFARAVQMPIPGIKITESNSGKRMITVNFTSSRLGEFKLRISFPTMYPRGATPSFQFIAPQTHQTETERIDILRCLSEVAAAKVAKNKLCLLPCIEALANWISTKLGDIVDPHPPTPVGIGHPHITSPTSSLSSLSLSLAAQQLTTKSRARARSLPPAISGAFVSQQMEKEKKRNTQTLPPIEEANTPLKLYTVASTDTLMGIAIAFKMHPTVLKKLNRLYSNQIIPGQQLWVHKFPDATPLHSHPLISTHSESSIASPLPDSASSSSSSSISSASSSTLPKSSSSSNLPSLSNPPATETTKIPKFSTKQKPIVKSEVIKHEIIYWSPTFCVGGTLTLTPTMLIFEPSIEDPYVIQGGILQFQLCIDLSQICTIKLFRTQDEYKHMLKIKRRKEHSEHLHKKNLEQQNKQEDEKDTKAKEIKQKEVESPLKEKPESSAPTIYPCIEIVVLHSRRMQTVYLGYLQLDILEPLYEQAKQRAMESRMLATQNGQPIPPNADLAISPLRPEANASAGGAANAGAHAGGAGKSALHSSMGSPLPAYLQNTQILDATCVKHLRTCLPSRFHNVDWELLYSTTLDGISIGTFYNHMRNAAPSLLLIEDSNGHVFGAYLSEPWQPDSKGTYYGTGESFLFSLVPAFHVYRWARKDDFFMCSCEEYIAVGGGEHGWGLYLDSDFDYGTSTHSTTFESPSLSSTPEFKCTVMEAWGFLSP